MSPELSPEFDIIIAGGGTTACVIAGRLAAASPSLKILVIESGQHSRDVPSHVQPCQFVHHHASNATTLTSYPGRPSIHLDGRGVAVRSGRAVGGGSVVNFMLYVRGAASDFDDWEALGNKGWSFNEVLPLFKKIETFTPLSDRPTHGYSGPIQISAGGTDLGFGEQFLNVAKAYDPDRPQVDDINDFKNANGYSRAYLYIDPTTGRRSDTASGYLYPHAGNPNLEIVAGKRVKRVIIENGRAVGVEYTSDTTSNTGAHGDLVSVKATKLVVVSAGAFGSPSILERSGIGAPSILEKNSARVLVDLPGVGENYQDHPAFRSVFYLSNETETMDDVWSDPEAVAARLEEWERNGTGKVAHAGVEAVVKMRPTAAQLASGGPALQSRWESFFRYSPDKPMGMIVPFVGLLLSPSASLGRKFLTTSYYILYPESTGSVHITSCEDANSPLEFNPGIFSKASDIAQLMLMYKMTRELVRRLPAYRGDVAAEHPQFPLDSPAACAETDGPVPIDVPDIAYSDVDDEAIAKFHRDRVTTARHSLGTCAMKPRHQGGVVDERLNVYGVQCLKVADLSICPTNVGNNTYSTALLIGEKAAVIIAEDLGVRLDDK